MRDRERKRVWIVVGSICRVVTVGLVVAGCRGAPLSSSSASEAGALEVEEGRILRTREASRLNAVAPSMPPLAAEWMERLELPSGAVVFVAPPVGSTEPRPMVVAVHGAMDDPGLICSAWRLITDVYPFIVCPGGRRVRESTYVWPSADAIAKAIDEAVAAAREKFGARIHDGPLVYAAFSQGANMAAPVLTRLVASERPTFGSAVLTEGGYRAFETRASAKAFRSAGGTRVLFTCSQPGCSRSFEGSRAFLIAESLEARIAYAGPYGHAMPPAVRASIHAELPWVVARLSGWEGYATGPKLLGD